MNKIKVFAKNAGEAITKIRKEAAEERKGTLYVLLKRHFFWIFWAFMCAFVAFGSGRPDTGAFMMAAPILLLLAIRLLKTAPGIILLAAGLAYGLYLVSAQVPRAQKFLEGTTYKFVSGKGAVIIPDGKDVVRLYAQDDFYAGDYMKKTGDTVRPGDLLIIANLSREIQQLEDDKRALEPRQAYLEHLLAENHRTEAEHKREQKRTRLQMKMNTLSRQQVAFEKKRFEKPTKENNSMMDAYRRLLKKGLISQQDFFELEKEYRRLEKDYKRLEVENELLAVEKTDAEEMRVLEKKYQFERANVEHLMARLRSKKQWLKQIVFVTAPGAETNSTFGKLLAPDPVPGLSGPANDSENHNGQGTAQNSANDSAALRAQLASTGLLSPWNGHVLQVSYHPEIDPWKLQPDRAPARKKGNGRYHKVPRKSESAGLQKSLERPWSDGEIIYLAGSRSSNFIRRGELVAEIWTGQKRRRIGLELLRSKMVGIKVGTMVNFLMDEEVGDIDSVLYGTIAKIRQYPDEETFWIESSDLKLFGGERNLEQYPLGLAGNFRIGIRSITHKEKYLKVKGEAKSIGEMVDGLRDYLVKYVKHMTGEDFIAESSKE